MLDQMQAGMSEAARLAHEGRLAEATAVIQRALGGTYAPAASDSPGDGGKSKETAFYVVDEAPRSAAPRNRGQASVLRGQRSHHCTAV